MASFEDNQKLQALQNIAEHLSSIDNTLSLICQSQQSISRNLQLIANRH